MGLTSNPSKMESVQASWPWWGRIGYNCTQARGNISKMWMDRWMEHWMEDWMVCKRSSRHFLTPFRQMAQLRCKYNGTGHEIKLFLRFLLTICRICRPLALMTWSVLCFYSFVSSWSLQNLCSILIFLHIAQCIKIHMRVFRFSQFRSVLAFISFRNAL